MKKIQKLFWKTLDSLCLWPFPSSPSHIFRHFSTAVQNGRLNTYKFQFKNKCLSSTKLNILYPISHLIITKKQQSWHFHGLHFTHEEISLER